MGAALARDAPPLVQTVYSTLMRTRLEVALSGLDGAGKTTVGAALREPGFAPRPAPPTIGLVVLGVRHRGIGLTLWDLGGHERFREDWGRHVRGCGALIFVVDAADGARHAEAREALQRLLEREPAVKRLPLLVLASKVDLLPAAERARDELLGWPALVDALGLKELGLRRWSVLGVSAARCTNVDKVLRWLVLQAHGAGGADGADEPAGGGGAPAGAWALWESWKARRRRWGKRRGFALVGGGALGSALIDEAEDGYVLQGG